MISFPNAKINIGLHVIGKRLDGYHSLESLFYPVPLQDALEVALSEKTSFTQTGYPLEIMPENNLVMKAYALLSEKYAIPPLRIFLKKTIPSGAGLGGGSADAAFMLRLLSQLYKNGQTISDLELMKMAESLGADCPFFIQNTPAIVTGKGDEFQKTDISLKGYHIYIVKPPISISTREAYAMVTPQKPSFSLHELSSMPVHEWKHVLKNDFEPSIFKKYPLIEAIKNNFYSMGADYASMSGSGSAVFGLFKRNVIPPTYTDCYSWKGILE